ncbi:hypothetical protein D1872_273400 [compost metagenome]
MLREIHRMLKPQGRFIIDFLNPAYTAAHLVPVSQRVDDGQRIDEQRAIEHGYVKKWITITNEANPGEAPRRYVERIKLYSRETFEAMLVEAGLVLEQVHGGYDEERYDPERSPRMIMVGRRP